MDFIPQYAKMLKNLDSWLGKATDFARAKGFDVDAFEGNEVVAVRESNAVIGDAGFGLFEPTGDVELGYTFARRAWGVGYATEAAAACLEAALAGLDVPRVIAVAVVENIASHRVAESIGMRRDGEIDAHGRPHVLFVGERP